ncbi:MAG: hypothetical protein JWO85_2470 [Candidatus Eremiobacteraeota bacterium]|nr:hypothetical protein [Candidatus Eremiobacteraeota bacterium]
MTLVVGAQNNDYALQVSDRRLTAEDGSAIDEESNKLFLLESDACRFIVGYSGLARLNGPGGFETKDWLATILRDTGPPDYNPDGIIDRLRDAATRKFATRSVCRLTPAARLLSIMLTGFVYTTTGPLVAYCMITNYQDYERGDDDKEPWPEFRAWWKVLQNPVRPAWSIQRIGFWRRFGPAQVAAVKVLVADRRPAEAVVGKTVELIREISGPAGSRSPVGRQLMSAVISSNRAEGSRFAYHTDVQQMTDHAPALIISRSDFRGPIVVGGTLTATDSNGKPIVVAYPKQPRNQLCACGSGQKFKRCHAGET